MMIASPASVPQGNGSNRPTAMTTIASATPQASAARWLSRGFIAAPQARRSLGLFDERDALLVAAALEFRLEERAHDLVGLLGLDPAPGERHDVDVVVGPRELGLVGVVRVDRAHPPHFVRDDRDADPGAADEHPALGVALRDELRRGAGVRRVVGLLVGVGSDVDDVVAGGGELLLDVLLELEAGVV